MRRTVPSLSCNSLSGSQFMRTTKDRCRSTISFHLNLVHGSLLTWTVLLFTQLILTLTLSTVDSDFLHPTDQPLLLDDFLYSPLKTLPTDSTEALLGNYHPIDHWLCSPVWNLLPSFIVMAQYPGYRWPIHLTLAVHLVEQLCGIVQSERFSKRWTLDEFELILVSTDPCDALDAFFICVWQRSQISELIPNDPFGLEFGSPFQRELRLSHSPCPDELMTPFQFHRDILPTSYGQDYPPPSQVHCSSLWSLYNICGFLMCLSFPTLPDSLLPYLN